MLRHGRAGVPMEVMGLMLGEFVDEYTVRVVDVFAMPQSGTGVSVEAVDPVFQTKMMEMLRQTGRYVLDLYDLYLEMVYWEAYANGDHNLDRRLLLDGITLTLVSDAGSLLLISTPNNPSNNLPPVPWLSS